MAKKDSKRPRQNIDNSDVTEEEMTVAEFYLYTRLHRKYGDDYEDPFAEGPERMADYIDAFIAFIKQTYPDHGLGNIDNLAALIRARVPSLQKVKESKKKPSSLSMSSLWRQVSDEFFEIISEIIRGMPKATLARLLRDYSPKQKKD